MQSVYTTYILGHYGKLHSGSSAHCDPTENIPCIKLCPEATQHRSGGDDGEGEGGEGEGGDGEGVEGEGEGGEGEGGRGEGGEGEGGDGGGGSDASSIVTFRELK